MSRLGGFRARPFLAAVAAVLVVALLHVGSEWGASPVAALSDLEQSLLDARFQLRGPLAPGPEVALVVYDDETLERAPELFERRRGFAQLLDAVVAAGARVVVLDVLFAREEALLPLPLLADIDAALGDPARADDPLLPLLTRVRQEASGDDVLEETLARAGRILLAFHLGREGVALQDAAPLVGGTYGQVVPGPYLPELSEHALTSQPRFMKAARAAGLLTVWADPVTGRVWSLPLARRVGESVYAPLSLVAVATFEGRGRADLAWLGTDGTARVGPRVVQGHKSNLLLNYRGPPGTFPTFSALDVVEQRVPVGALQDRIVLVGFTHLSQDRAATPFGARTPGLEVHATAIDNVLRGDELRRAPLAMDLALLLVAGLLVAFAFGWRRLGPAVQAAAVLAVGGATFGVAWALFVEGPLWVNASAPLLAVGLAAVAGLGASYLEEGRGRRQLKHTFSRYLSRELLDELLRDPGRLSLSGERREVTVLFTDIRGFTTLAERTAPLELAAFLNRFFTPMTAAVLSQGGYLDKYIGDAIMAVFGAPVPRASHPADACRAALAMHAALRELKRSGGPMFEHLGMGVGINTGEGVVGNLGSEERFDYTVVGDSVNLASRLEGLTKRYGVFCLVGEGTRGKLGEELPVRPVDLVRVKGKDQPEAIYELLLEPLADPEAWDEAVQAWRQGRLDDAHRAFARWIERVPDDPVARVYLERLAVLDGQLPAGWDGVFTHDEK